MIRDRGVANRYAAALFGAAEKRGVAEEVLADMESVVGLEQTSVSLQAFLDSPSVLDKHKEHMITTILHGRVHELVVQLLLLMLRKKRSKHFPLVFPAYRSLVEEKLGILSAEVVTAVPLEAETLLRIKAQLEKTTGKKLRMETRVDPSILGGVVAIVGGEVLDSSIRNQLEKIREGLLAATVLRAS